MEVISGLQFADYGTPILEHRARLSIVQACRNQAQHEFEAALHLQTTCGQTVQEYLAFIAVHEEGMYAGGVEQAVGDFEQVFVPQAVFGWDVEEVMPEAEEALYIAILDNLTHWLITSLLASSQEFRRLQRCSDAALGAWVRYSFWRILTGSHKTYHFDEMCISAFPRPGHTGDLWPVAQPLVDAHQVSENFFKQYHTLRNYGSDYDYRVISMPHRQLLHHGGLPPNPFIEARLLPSGPPIHVQLDTGAGHCLINEAFLEKIAPEADVTHLQYPEAQVGLAKVLCTVRKTINLELFLPAFSKGGSCLLETKVQALILSKEECSLGDYILLGTKDMGGLGVSIDVAGGEASIRTAYSVTYQLKMLQAPAVQLYLQQPDAAQQ